MGREESKREASPGGRRWDAAAVLRKHLWPGGTVACKAE